MVDVNKELEPIIKPEGLERQSVAEEVPTVESPRKSENVEPLSFLEKLERRFGRTQPQTTGDVQDDTNAKPSDNTQSKQPPVTLSISASQMQAGNKLSPDFSLAWMVIWAKRQIQKLMRQDRKVLFSPEKSQTSEKL